VIEVTPAMIEAGKMVIIIEVEQFMKEHLGDPPLLCTDSGLLERVYRAMRGQAVEVVE
jgi:hypothetical protein